MRLVIDFDNTIVAYDGVFVATARERGLITHDVGGTKQAIRDAVRSLPDGERAWQLLQADVYGEFIRQARPFAGVREFVIAARARGAHVTIVSHKTAFAAARPNGVNLRDAARAWLGASGLIGLNLIEPNDIYFESSRAAKVERIRALRADIAIDDLVEVLTDPSFPPNTRRWLFAPDRPSCRCPDVESFGSWDAMRLALER